MAPSRAAWPAPRWEEAAEPVVHGGEDELQGVLPGGGDGGGEGGLVAMDEGGPELAVGLVVGGGEGAQRAELLW